MWDEESYLLARIHFSGLKVRPLWRAIDLMIHTRTSSNSGSETSEVVVYKLTLGHIHQNIFCPLVGAKVTTTIFSVLGISFTILIPSCICYCNGVLC